MAVPRVARLASKAKLDTGVLAHGGQALDDHGRLLGAELGHEVRALVDADFGRGGIQIEG